MEVSQRSLISFRSELVVVLLQVRARHRVVLVVRLLVLREVEDLQVLLPLAQVHRPAVRVVVHPLVLQLLQAQQTLEK